METPRNTTTPGPSNSHMRAILDDILDGISSNNDTPPITANRNIREKYITKPCRYKKPRATTATKGIAELQATMATYLKHVIK